MQNDQEKKKNCTKRNNKYGCDVCVCASLNTEQTNTYCLGSIAFPFRHSSSTHHYCVGRHNRYNNDNNDEGEMMTNKFQTEHGIYLRRKKKLLRGRELHAIVHDITQV